MNRSKALILHLSADGRHVPQIERWLKGTNQQVRQAAVPIFNNPGEAVAYQEDKLLSQIQWSDVLVVLISPAAANDASIAWAVECAQRLGKRVIGIWLEGANEGDLPGALDEFATAVVPADPVKVIEAVDGGFDGICSPDGKPRPERAIARHNC